MFTKSNMSTFMGLASVLILPTLAFLTPCPRYMWGQFTPGDSHHPDGHSPALAVVIPASWGLFWVSPLRPLSLAK